MTSNDQSLYIAERLLLMPMGLQQYYRKVIEIYNIMKCSLDLVFTEDLLNYNGIVYVIKGDSFVMSKPKLICTSYYNKQILYDGKRINKKRFILPENLHYCLDYQYDLEIYIEQYDESRMNPITNFITTPNIISRTPITKKQMSICAQYCYNEYYELWDQLP